MDTHVQAHTNFLFILLFPSLPPSLDLILLGQSAHFYPIHCPPLPAFLIHLSPRSVFLRECPVAVVCLLDQQATVSTYGSLKHTCYATPSLASYPDVWIPGYKANIKLYCVFKPYKRVLSVSFQNYYSTCSKYGIRHSTENYWNSLPHCYWSIVKG